MNNRDSYMQSVDLVARSGCDLVDIDTSKNQLEYPFQALLLERNPKVRFYHAGVELGVFEGLTTCTAGGAMTLDQIMNVPLIRCDEVQWAFLGISMAGWNAILSLGGAALIFVLSRRRVRA